MGRKLTKKIFCMVMALSLILPSFVFSPTDMAHAATKYTDKYNLQMKTFDVVNPAAKTNPFSMEVGQTLNVGVEVCDENGYEYTEDDGWGGLDTVYTNVVWKAEDSGLSISGNNTNYVGVKANTPGKHYITVTYGDKIAGTDVKPLKLEVNVTGAAGTVEETIFKFDVATNTITGLKDKNNPTTIVIPEKINGVAVKHIGENAFKYFSSGGNVNNKITELQLPEGLETTGCMSFQGNDIKKVVIPSTLKTLGERTFFGNKNLTSVDFSNAKNLTEIGDSCFYQTGLSNVTIPDGVTVIGPSAFKELPLKSITLPSTIKNIGEQAFSLDLLEEVTLPAGIEKLNESSRGRQGNGIFYRNFAKKDAGSNTSGTLRFTKIYDTSGKATVLNTRGVVNPCPLTINFKKENGEDIKPAETFTGAEYNTIEMVKGKYTEKPELRPGSGKYYKDYINPFKVSKASNKIYTDNAFAEKIIGENYFAEGRTYTVAAPEIRGWIKPADQIVKLSKETNTVTFTYKEAEKLTITKEGDGITLDPADGKAPQGSSVTVTILEPENKTLKALFVDGKDVTKDAKFNGICYKYTFEANKNTTVKADYTKSDKLNKLELKLDKNKVTLGEKVNFTLTYRGNKLDLTKASVEILDTAHKHTAVDKTAKTILAKDADEITLNVKVTDNPTLTASAKLTAEPVKVSIRMEDDKSTAFEKTEVSIDKLYLTKGENYYADIEFDVPTPILAAEKLLKANGIDTADKAKFDCSANGGWMKQFGGNQYWKFMNENGSFMYTVNNTLSDKLFSEHHLNNDDSICVFYDPNWQKPSTIAFFEKEDYNKITAGDTLEVKLMNVPITMDGTTPAATPLEGATIEITDLSGSSHKAVIKTDKNGCASIIFDTPGEYKLSASGEGTPAPFSRPFAKVLVEKKVIMGETLITEDGLASIKLPSQKDITDLKLVCNISDAKPEGKLTADIMKKCSLNIVNTTTGEAVSINKLLSNKEKASIKVKLPENLANEKNLIFAANTDGSKKFDAVLDNGYISFNADSLADFYIIKPKAEVTDGNAGQSESGNNDANSNSDKTNASKPEINNSDKKAPATGDASNILAIILIIAASSLALAATRKKEDTN